MLVHTPPSTHHIGLYVHMLFLRDNYILGALYKLSAVFDSGFPESRAEHEAKNKALIIYVEVQTQGSKSDET